MTQGTCHPVGVLPHPSSTDRGLFHLRIDGDPTAPPIVLVHGLGGSHCNWLSVTSRLHNATGRTILVPDLPGFGRTPRGTEPATVDRAVSRLGAFLEHEHGPVVLVGNSMGGLVSLALAAQRPWIVDKLVLTAPACTPAGPLDREVALAFAIYAVPFLGEAVVRRRLQKISPERSVAEVFSLCCYDRKVIEPFVMEASIQLATDRRSSMPWTSQAFVEAARSVVHMIARPNLIPSWLMKVKAPTMFIQGTHDRLVHIAASRQLHAKRPEFRFEVLNQIGHIPQLETPDLYTSLVKDFVGVAASRPKLDVQQTS